MAGQNARKYSPRDSNVVDMNYLRSKDVMVFIMIFFVFLVSAAAVFMASFWCLDDDDDDGDGGGVGAGGEFDGPG